MATCHYHPDRPGIGVCMRCRSVICAACCTRVDGVNHCHSCLKALGRRTTPAAPGLRTGTLVAVHLIALSWLALFGILCLVQGALAP